MKTKWMTLLLALLLACSACTAPAVQTEGPAEGEYGVYFLRAVPSAENGFRSSAESACLDRELHALSQEERTVEVLTGLLLAGPEGESLVSPFPAGTRVRSWRQEGGRVILDLSETYGGLTGVELTLADGCIVLTLCQLPGVEEVYITVEGRRRPFRDQVYTAADFIEDNRFDLLLPQESGEPPAEETQGEEVPGPTPPPEG